MSPWKNIRIKTWPSGQQLAGPGPASACPGPGWAPWARVFPFPLHVAIHAVILVRRWRVGTSSQFRLYSRSRMHQPKLQCTVPYIEPSSLLIGVRGSQRSIFIFNREWSAGGWWGGWLVGISTKKQWYYDFSVGGLQLARIDPSRRGSMDEPRANLLLLRKIRLLEKGRAASKICQNLKTENNIKLWFFSWRPPVGVDRSVSLRRYGWTSWTNMVIKTKTCNYTTKSKRKLKQPRTPAETGFLQITIY